MAAEEKGPGQINHCEGVISVEAPLASIPEEKNNGHAFAMDGKQDQSEDVSSIADRDAVLAQIEREKTLALIRAWEESEKAKAVNRAHKKLVDIGSWETNRRATVEELIKKTEEETEKMKVEAAEKVRIKIAEIHKEAEMKKSAIVSERGEDITKVEVQAAKFRSTGHVPRNLFGCFNC